MSRAFSSGKLQGQERKEILQAVQEQAKVAACAAIKPILEAFLEAEVRTPSRVVCKDQPFQRGLFEMILQA